MTCKYGYSHFIHVKTVATDVKIKFLSTLIRFPSLLAPFGSAFFSSKEGGCPGTFVHMMNVQVIGYVHNPCSLMEVMETLSHDNIRGFTLEPQLPLILRENANEYWLVDFAYLIDSLCIWA